MPAELPELVNVKQAAAYEVTDNLTGKLEDWSLPDAYDFQDDPRNKGQFTKVKHQGKCSSCWAYTAATVYESYIAQLTHRNADILSPQELMECARREGVKSNCDPGYPDEAFNYIRIHGLHSEAEYPYWGVVSVNRMSWNSLQNNSISLFISQFDSTLNINMILAIDHPLRSSFPISYTPLRVESLLILI